MPKKLLAIDARPLARDTGGIQRYLTEILPHLVNSEKFEIILYSDHPIKPKTPVNGSPIRTRSIKHGIARAAAWHYWVCKWTASDQPDIFWSPRHHLPFILPDKTRSVVTIHDFVWRTAPESMPPMQLISEKLMMPTAIKRANKIICVSQTTKKHIIKSYPESESKAHVILHGNDVQTSKPLKAQLRKPFFLAVGTLEPRKNYVRLLEAFEEYSENGGCYDLVIIGKEGWNYQKIYQTLSKNRYRDRVNILNNTDDQQLINFYQSASGFISVSIDEGYGLPPQEAAQFGLPILLSRIDVYLELYPLADFWADPYSKTELANSLLGLEKTGGKRQQNTQLSNRSWATCANEHMKLIALASK